MPKTSPPTQTSGFAIASLVLGFFFFVPLIGFMMGIAAIVLGVIALSELKKKQQKGKKLAIAGIILGVLGILVTISVYGALFYVGFIMKGGPMAEVKIMASKQILTQDSGLIELYKVKHGKYPRSLEEVRAAGYSLFGSDHFLKPFHYQISDDGQSYDLRSLGPDGELNTADDILPK